MDAGEFVADLRDSDPSDLHLHQLRIFEILRHNHCVHFPSLIWPAPQRHILRLHILFKQQRSFRRLHDPPNQNVAIPIHTRPRQDQPIIIQLDSRQVIDFGGGRGRPLDGQPVSRVLAN